MDNQAGPPPILIVDTEPSLLLARSGRHLRTTYQTLTVGKVPLTSLGPLLCACHCALTPVVIALAPSLRISPAWEWGFLAISLPMAVWGVRSGMRIHQQTRVLFPVIIGLVLWCTGLSFEALGWHEAATVGGAMLLAAGLFWNANLRHRSLPCTCLLHSGEDTQDRGEACHIR